MTQLTPQVTTAARPSFLWQGLVASLTAHSLVAAGYLVLFLIWPGSQQDPVVPYPPERDYAAITIPASAASGSQSRQSLPISVTPAPRSLSPEPPLQPASVNLLPVETPRGEVVAGEMSSEPIPGGSDAQLLETSGRPRRDDATDRLPETPSSAGAISRANAGVDTLLTPRVLMNPAPRYPADALQQQLEGTVMLRVQVAADGAVTSVRIIASSGTTSLDNAAVDAVQRWRFLPARDPAAAAREVNVPIEFLIQRRAVDR